MILDPPVILVSLEVLLVLHDMDSSQGGGYVPVVPVPGPGVPQPLPHLDRVHHKGGEGGGAACL